MSERNAARIPCLDWRTGGASAALLLVLTGCSVPNWANPVRWYDGVADQFRADPAAPGNAQAPPLSSVPERPRVTPAEDRRQITQGLVADREGARYTDDVVRRAEDTSGPAPSVRVAAPPPPPPTVARAEPPPPPRPSAVPPPAAVARAEPPRVEPAPPAPRAPDPLAERRVATPETRTAQAADPLAERRITGAPSPTPAPSLADRRVAPAAPPLTAADDSLDSRRTITSGRVGTRPSTGPTVPPATVVTTPAAPAPRQAQPIAPTIVQQTPPAVAQTAPAPSLPPAPRAAAEVPRAGPAAVVGTTPAFVPPRPTVGVAPGETVVSQTFARMLAESASSVTTAPDHISFARPTAAHLGPRDTTAPAIGRDTFNTALRGGEAPAAALPGRPGATVVRFGNGSAKLEGDYGPALRRVADAQRASGGRVRIVGYASSRSGATSAVDGQLINFRMSLDRAQSVANELMRLGVPAQAIFMEGRGEERRAPGTPAEVEAESRRAEVYLES
jgi:outer membrane protein OmpA-like peptidoglycan-associated protein